MKAYLVIITYEYKTTEWSQRGKKFVTVGETLHGAAKQVQDDFIAHNSSNVVRNVRAVSASEIEAELAIPETRGFIPTA